VQEIVSQLIPTAIIGVCGFVVWFLKKLGTSVDILNHQMAVYVERVTMILDHIEDHESRLRRIEGDLRDLN
jgi:hypothetical protein